MCGLLLRIFLEPSPYLPRSYPVATPLPSPYFRLTNGLASAYFNIACLNVKSILM